MSIYDIPIELNNGETITLEKFKGKKLMIVNTASKCRFTKQYQALQEMQEEYRESLVVIGAPTNQFAKQEPGTDDEIEEFCKMNYGVTFLLTKKLKVKGPNQHPLYTWLTTKKLNGHKDSTVRWNFQKYILDEHGAILNKYYAVTKPNSRRIKKYLK